MCHLCALHGGGGQPRAPMCRRRAPPAGRKTPSVACIVQPGSTGFQKLFFGSEEIAIPVYPRCAAGAGRQPS